MKTFYEVTRVVKTYIKAESEEEALEKFEEEDFVFEDSGKTVIEQINEEKIMMKMMGEV
jgi:hypothetical protein